ncbi:hypothetical protein KC340_g1634 [Hortaea werneckii]|nr:hypothetical protein KC342_g2593 [Hortaea werneckii]KAI7106337.1 hypothetical protein KC339_g3180 [Hortaea werneckii]KAI7244509.1 hypothetical protein KC365_g1347 [Hortaea werneckii]KAI7336637.1 hypothetical protein KC340_g1634 [Hortaea werneckii]KAI7386041.1 hypothetical protein KC328_g10040 [Hortaea werneckii]
MFLYQSIRQKLPWSNSSPEVTQQSQTGFSNDKPSYAAILKLDLEDAGAPPARIQPPLHLDTSKPQSATTTNEPSAIPQGGEHTLPRPVNLASQSTTSDLRAPCEPFKRHRAKLKKYYSFKAIHQGQLNQPHISDRNPFDTHASWFRPLYTHDDPRCPVTVLTKRMLYEEAQWLPKPPRWHKSVRWHFMKRKGKGKRGVGRGVSKGRLLFGAGADVGGEFAIA